MLHASDKTRNMWQISILCGGNVVFSVLCVHTKEEYILYGGPTPPEFRTQVCKEGPCLLIMYLKKCRQLGQIAVLGRYSSVTPRWGRTPCWVGTPVLNLAEAERRAGLVLQC